MDNVESPLLEEPLGTEETDCETTDELEEGPLNAPGDGRVTLDKADRSLSEFHRWYKQGRIIVDPEWQRNYVWDTPRASKLIESFLLDIPVPVVYLNKTADGKYEVIDGLQRLTSVFRYLDNEFALSRLDIRTELNGKRYHELPEQDQRKLEDVTLRSFELTHGSRDIQFIVFERLNTGGGTSTTGYTRTHDAVGNLIDDGEDYEYVYDPFGRLKEVRKTSNQALVAEYRYNGLGFRVGWHYDTDADTDVDGGDLWYFFAYDEGWRLLATYRSTDSSPKEQFGYHNAGLGGYGGSSYIDAVVLRDRDANTAWDEAADGVLEERLNYCQNWRADVVAIVSSAGKLVERARYSAYGRPTAFPTGDTDCDGDWDATDSTDIGSNYTPGSTYAVLRDADLDGDVDAADVTHANSITGGYQTLGRDVLTSAAVGNRIGYAGYQYDPTFNGLDRHLSHVRHRVYDAEAGRWTRRDPLGYVDGSSVYGYVAQRTLVDSDPMGLFAIDADAGCECQLVPEGTAPAKCGTEAALLLLAAAGLANAPVCVQLEFLVASGVTVCVLAILYPDLEALLSSCARSEPKPISIPIPRAIPRVIPRPPACPPCPPGTSRFDKSPPSAPHWPCPGDHVHTSWNTGQGPWPQCICSYAKGVWCLPDGPWVPDK